MNKLVGAIVYNESLNHQYDQHFKRLFPRRKDQLAEEYNLSKKNISFAYKLSNIFYYAHIRASSLKFSDKKTSDRVRICANNFIIDQNDRLRPLGLTCIIYIALTLAKFVYQVFLRLQFDYMASEWLAKATKSLNHSEGCISRDELERYRESDPDSKSIEWVVNRLDSLGYPFQFADEGSLFICLDVLFGLNICLVSLISIGKKGIQVDSMSFIERPLQELKIIEAELREVIVKLVSNVKNQAENMRLWESHRLLMTNEHQQRNQSSIFRPNCSIDCQHFTTKFFGMLYEIQNNYLLIPYVYSSHYHTVSSRFGCFYFIAGNIEGIVIIIGIIITLTYHELSSRVMYRVSCLECYASDYIGVPIESNQKLPELRESSEMSKYLTYINETISESTRSVSYLELILIEAVRGFRWDILLCWIELVALVLLTGAALVLYTTIFYQNQMTRGVWARDIKLQLETCTHMLIREQSGELPVSDSLLLNRCLLISYLDMELFKKRHKQHSAFIYIILLQVTSLSLCSMFFCYIASTYFNQKTLFLFYVAMSAAFVLNIVLLVSVGIMSEIVAMMRAIDKLVLVSSFYSLERSYVIDLFRRQLLDDKDIKNFYAIEFLGVKVSYGNIFYFNFYMCILWLISTFH